MPLKIDSLKVSHWFLVGFLLSSFLVLLDIFIRSIKRIKSQNNPLIMKVKYDSLDNLTRLIKSELNLHVVEKTKSEIKLKSKFVSFFTFGSEITLKVHEFDEDGNIISLTVMNRFPFTLFDYGYNDKLLADFNDLIKHNKS
jgi:hypothetical protein